MATRLTTSTHPQFWTLSLRSVLTADAVAPATEVEAYTDVLGQPGQSVLCGLDAVVH